MNEPPVRLCCSQRHDGLECPDGRVMCVICFELKDQSELNIRDGQIENVCKSCAAAEARVLASAKPCVDCGSPHALSNGRCGSCLDRKWDVKG